MVAFTYNEFDKILYVNANGVLEISDMVEASKYLLTNTQLPRMLRIIENAIGATSNFSVPDIHILAENLEETTKHYINIRHAVIHDSPKNFALSFLMDKLISDKNYSFQSFSTLEAAKFWVMKG
jgi:hypothetical protein